MQLASGWLSSLDYLHHAASLNLSQATPNPDGSLTYSRAVGAKKYAAAGLDPQHPTAAGLVKVGAVDSPERVATVFLFPHIWDVTIWVLPNPDGPFADKNPNVKPSQSPRPRLGFAQAARRTPTTRR